MNDQLPSTRTLLLGIWSHLSRRRRIQLVLLLLVMLASGGAELVSLGAVLPFLAVLSNPEQLWKQPLVHALATSVGFMEASQLLLPATLVLMSAAVVSALIRLANLWVNGRLAAAVGSDLSCRATGARLSALRSACAAKQLGGNCGDHYSDSPHGSGAHVRAAADDCGARSYRAVGGAGAN